VSRAPAAPRRAVALALAFALAPTVAGSPALATHDLSPIDLVDLEVAYDTLTTQYYRRLDPQRIIDGAHVGIVAYLRGRGIGDPRVPSLRASGRYAHDLHAPGQEVAAAVLRYGSRIDAHDLVYAAIAGEVAAPGDPYTVFFTPAQEQQFYRFLNPPAFGGIGVILHVDAKTTALVVDDVIPGGPADRAGLRAGDAIVAIDGVATSGQSIDAMQGRLRGALGTTVRISYARDGADVAVPLEVVRARVTPPDAFGRMLAGGVGYLQLTSYGADAAKQLERVMRTLDAQGARSYVLDLRGNGGGYRDAAIAVTSAFIPPGPVVTMQARSGKRTTLRTIPSTPPRKPLAVLVNGDTASAAEITASAIQDTGSGTLVGTRTFGKGLVQQMYPLPDRGAMKVTVERYYTVRGRDIDRRGVDPDVVVSEPDGSVPGDPDRDPQLARALSILSAPAAPAPSSR